METKGQIRQQYLSLRNAMPEEQAFRLSVEISDRLSDFLKTIDNLSEYGCYGYYPHGREVSLLKLYQDLLYQGIPLAFPRVCQTDMEFYQIQSLEDFQEGTFHILEPKESCPKVSFENACCFVPGVVFDQKGTRYGYGKGYYDKYLARHSGLKRIGIAYSYQMPEDIPAAKEDISMEYIVNEINTLWIDHKERGSDK